MQEIVQNIRDSDSHYVTWLSLNSNVQAPNYLYCSPLTYYCLWKCYHFFWWHNCRSIHVTQHSLVQMVFRDWESMEFYWSVQVCYIEIILALENYSCEFCPYFVLLLKMGDIIHSRNWRDQSLNIFGVISLLGELAQRSEYFFQLTKIYLFGMIL